MQSLLICEKNEEISDSFVAKLCSNFPVRQFNCIKQVNQYLAKYSRTSFRRDSKANLLMDIDTLDISLAECRQSMSHLAKLGTTLILSSHHSQNDLQSLNTLEQGSKNEYLVPRQTHIEQLRTTIDYLMYDTSNRNQSKLQAIKYKNIEFDYDSLEIKFLPDRQTESLPLKEAKILLAFLERPGQIVSREDLTSRVWGMAQVSPRSLDCHISRLRKKISDSGLAIASEYGGGYCFD